MPRIEDYALIGDTQTAALVSRDGSMDWLCLPRFDSGACFAALLGTPDHGRWWLGPTEKPRAVTRRYRPGTLVLETDYELPGGRVRVIDCMPPRGREPDVVRCVEGLEGTVQMGMELTIRFDYGSIVPWVTSREGVLYAVGGPDALALHSPVPTRGVNLHTAAEFTVSAGQQLPFLLTWYPSHLPPPPAVDPEQAAQHATEWWRQWSRQCTYEGPWREAVQSSLVVLKALTYSPTGGIVAAATTSLPEHIGGPRNWDYRYCWLRDATFTLYSMLLAGYTDEAAAWRDWLLRSVAGSPEDLQIMYGAAGERRLPELVLDWLPGYEASAPVRIGNAAASQLQLDVYGEVMDVLHQCRRANMQSLDDGWALQLRLLEFLETGWRTPDFGLWEVRGAPRHFTHSKVMAWVAFDRAIKAVECFGKEGPVDHWRAMRDAIHREVCEKGYDASKQCFTQSYGSPELDASLLVIPQVGFLPATDKRMLGTIRAIERELVHDGFVHRYRTEEVEDGLPPGEGKFLLCSFWLADNYALTGRIDEARRLFERLVDLRNDVGLLAEEYDPVARRQLGNFPQAFSHVGLINTAYNLTAQMRAPAVERQGG